MKADGTIITSINGYAYGFPFSNENDKYFCVKDNAYTIGSESSYAVCSWIVKSRVEGTYDYVIIDTITGNEMLSGYSYYDVYRSDSAVYLYAKNYTSNGYVCDIYVLK
jgi:hypothetical protein